MSLIQGSVGKDGKNHPQDVKVVQRLLNKNVIPPLRALTVDGIAGQNTIESIKHFQTVVVKMRVPDGRVDPGGKTLRFLNRENRTDIKTSNSSQNGNRSNLSGAKWWHANQSKYPNSNKLGDLEGNFREKVTNFVAALRKAGAKVSISSTRRNKIRAHLMHYSWKVARGDIHASEVPTISGLNIQWDHGDEKASRKAARQMMRLFKMAHLASLKSNHIHGKAIDMTISWKGRLVIGVPGSDDPVIIQSGSKTGAKNRKLHRVGRLFGVKKLLKDPPHWSHNGR